jgi:hypothetical protein
VLFKQFEYLVGFPSAVAKGEEVRLLRTGLVPFGLAGNLPFDWRTRKIESVGLWHGPSLTPTEQICSWNQTTIQQVAEAIMGRQASIIGR